MSMATLLNKLSLATLVKFQGLTYAEVLAYDADEYTVDLQPLKFRKGRNAGAVENVQYAKMYDIPIALQGGKSFSIKPDYAKGDIVIVSFSTSRIRDDDKPSSDIDDILNKSNAIVVGSIGETKTAPAVKITSSEIVFTIGTTKFTIDAMGATVSVGGVTVNLFTHLHGTAVGPTTPPTPGT